MEQPSGASPCVWTTGGATIRIESLNGWITEFEVEDSPDKLASEIHSRVGVPLHEQRLFFVDRELQRGCTLESQGVPPGATLRLVRPGHFQIFVQTPGGLCATLDVEPSHTVGSVKTQLFEIGR